MIQNEKDRKRNNEVNIKNNDSDILEQGDIYFFYRPKKNFHYCSFPVTQYSYLIRYVLIRV
jgi:hypothetical protein